MQKLFKASTAATCAAIAIIATVGIVFALRAPPNSGDDAVATVNGASIPNAEIVLAIKNGTDRANAIDTAINRAIFAAAAEKEYGPQAAAAVKSVTREILAQTYLSESSKRYGAEITDADINTWYTQNIRPDDFKLIKAKYILATSRDVAQAAADAAKVGDTKKFEPLTKGDGFLPAQAIPYNLGPSLAKTKIGEVLGPLTVRDGMLVIVVDAEKDGAVPTLEASKDNIRNILVREKLSAKLAELRAQATISLK